MPRFLSPIYVGLEIVTGNEVISGNETILGITSGKNCYWDDLTTHGTISSKGHIYGTLFDWMTLVRGYNISPSLSVSLTSGDVYTYTYSTSGNDVNYYRYIANDGSLDAFYSYFSGNTLSGLVASKSIIL